MCGIVAVVAGPTQPCAPGPRTVLEPLLEDAIAQLLLAAARR